MLVLALDTATTRITAGVVEGPGEGAQRSSTQGPGDGAQGRTPPGRWSARTLSRVDREGARAHAELLVPAITEALASAGVDRRALDAVVCGVGPGPFTGLRVGLVTAAALGDGLALPVHGAGTHAALLHDAVAGGAAELAPGSRRLAVTDARRREVYWALAGPDGAVEGPAVSTPADLAARVIGLGDVAGRAALRTDPAPTVVVGDAAASFAALVEELGGPDLTVVECPGPSPAALVSVVAAQLRDGAGAGPLVPLYLRRPDAVPPGAPKAVRR